MQILTILLLDALYVKTFNQSLFRFTITSFVLFQWSFLGFNYLLSHRQHLLQQPMTVRRLYVYNMYNFSGLVVHTAISNLMVQLLEAMCGGPGFRR